MVESHRRCRPQFFGMVTMGAHMSEIAKERTSVRLGWIMATALVGISASLATYMLTSRAADLSATVTHGEVQYPPIDATREAKRDGDSLRGYFRIVVANNGSTTARAVTLEIPDIQRIEIDRKDGNVETLNDTERFVIGNIQPTQSTVVRAWTVAPPPSADVRQISLTHEEGQGSVGVPRAAGRFD